MKALAALVGFVAVRDWRRGLPHWAHRLYLWGSGERSFTDIGLRERCARCKGFGLRPSASGFVACEDCRGGGIALEGE